jgi:hypothetical protein
MVRIFLWNLADSKTSIADLRQHLPELEPRDAWISNEASERFGLVSFEDGAPAVVAEVRDVIGRDPDVAEEFDIEA